jgi:hypothetical protein
VVEKVRRVIGAHTSADGPSPASADEAAGATRARGDSNLGQLLAFLFGDVIAAAHVVMIVGMLSYDPDNQIIPPLHLMSTTLPLRLVVSSYCAYQMGRLLSRWRRPREREPLSLVPPGPPPATVTLLACACAAVVLGVQAANVISKGSLADVALAKANSSEDFGPLVRIIYTALPFLTALIFYASRFHPWYRRLAYPLIAACLVGLALTMFKVSIVLFLIALLYLSAVARGTRHPSLLMLLRSPATAVAVAAIAIVMYYLSEGEDLFTSAAVVLARALVFSWEGFAYVVETPAAPDLAEQLQVFVGMNPLPPPDILLATQMLGVDPPPIGIVVTFPGFLYRNFADLGVAVGALLLGIAAQRALDTANATNRPACVVLGLFGYLGLVDVFLVGNLLHAIRGTGLTLAVTCVIVLLLERARDGRPVAGHGIASRAPIAVAPRSSEP